MEFKKAKSLVYNAARSGNLPQLRVFLEHREKEEANMFLVEKTNGATPLIMACRNGHQSVVEYMVEKYDADVEQVGSVTFDGETIDGAPPLWCAAAAGHLGIVQYLIKMGAGVNNTTFTNSTPLRAACFDGHFNIVQYLIDHNADIEIANRHGHTCLMISCYKGQYRIVRYLLEKGAYVNRKSLKGNTALHDCAESGCLEIMKLLLSNNAVMDKDAYGMTPLLAAAVTGHTNIVEYLIKRQGCTREEQIDALELLGSTYVDKKRDMLGALKYWRKAMEQRYCDSANVIAKPTLASPIVAYDNAVEVTTSEQLKTLLHDADDMRMQALLVRERILGPAHPDTSYYIRYRGAVYADMGNFDRCITLWMYALDMQQKILEPLSPMTHSSFLSFAELFSFMMTDGKNRKPYAVGFEDMMIVFDKAMDELQIGMAQGMKTVQKDRDVAHFSRLVVIIMHLICLLCRIQNCMTEEQEFRFKKTAYRLVQMNPCSLKDYTPLHLACTKGTSTVGRYPVCEFPSPEVVRVLLDVGASVNAVDIDQNTPLHVAAMKEPCNREVIKVLLDYGAHVDACNIDHKTPMQLFSGSDRYEVISPLNYVTLQCLAARKIIESGIVYKGCVPSKLEGFISLH